MPVSTIEGQELESCDIELFSHKRFFIVIVTGATWNPCGHMLLNLDGVGGHYFHVAKAGFSSEKPKYFTEAQYRTYLAAFHKEELLRYEVSLPFPHQALMKLEELVSKDYPWLLLAHNCSSFVEEVLRAGGWPYYMTSCPRLTELIIEYVAPKAP